jgi:predicted deacylase
MSVEPAYVAAAVAGIRNVLRWADMLGDEMEPISGIRLLSPGYTMRRAQHPFSPTSGIVSYLVRAGDSVAKGEPVARLADIYGRPLGENDGRIYSELDGIVLGVSQGAVCYQGDPLLSLAIRDDSDLVVPFPS